MLQATTRSHRAAPRRVSKALTAVATALSFSIAVSCGGSSSAAQRAVEPGTYAQTAAGDFFFVDPSFGGQAASIRVARQFFGRLVSIDAFTDEALTQRITVHEDFVIDPRVETAWSATNYTLETNPITAEQTLVIRRNFNDVSANGGREQFRQLLASAESGVQAVVDSGFFSSSSSMVPRNAAFVLVLDDLIDPATINAGSVRVIVGAPAILPLSARILADPNHGALADFDGQQGLEFYSTRLIIDPAVSELESFGSDPFLASNTLGFPASTDVTRANVEVRVATSSVGQLQPILQNPTQHPLATASNGTVDFSAGSLDVVRLFRSGGQEVVTNDPYNGFLPDATPPVLVGVISSVIEDIRATLAPDLFELDLLFLSSTCAQEPRPGDIIIKDAIVSEVVSWGQQTLINGVIASDVLVRLIALPSNYTGPGQFVVGPAEYRVAYDPIEDLARQACFVRTSPGVPSSNSPMAAVDPRASFRLRFNEAMDPDQFEPYETFGVLRSPPPLAPGDFIPAGDFIPGNIRNDISFQEFRFEPQLPLSHQQGSAETYYIVFPEGQASPRDLAGNVLEAVLPPIEFSLNPSAPSELTGGRVTRFQSADEEPPFADPMSPDPIDSFPQPEWFGQISHALDRGRIRPRPVVRTRTVVSGSNQVPSAMPLGPGTTLPLTPFGARTQILWRYIDFGDSLPLNRQNDVANDLDLSLLNIDVERVWLSPRGASPVFEAFPEFQMSMSHSRFLPDEGLTPALTLLTPASGLQAIFANNELDAFTDPPQIVHPRELGYTVQPGQLELSMDGTPLIPLPMNGSGVPASQRLYYTWRDTALMRRGGPGGAGAPPARNTQITGQGPFAPLPGPDCSGAGPPNPLYLPGEIRTAALPLLIDLRCYPTGGAATSNVFVHRLAHTTMLPGFRAFSAGGRDVSGALTIVDPDGESTANGGFDPTSTPAGNNIPGVDNTLYFGALDLVVRVSRAHSIFFPAADPFDPQLTPFSAPTHAEPVVFPEISPQGTRIDLAFRGAANVSQIAREDASRSDAYGDFYLTTPLNYTPGGNFDPTVSRQGNASCWDGSFSFPVAAENVNIAFQGGNAWRPEISEIDGARWFQVRATFTADAATGRVPEIAALGFAWSN